MSRLDPTGLQAQGSACTALQTEGRQAVCALLLLFSPAGPTLGVTGWKSLGKWKIYKAFPPVFLSFFMSSLNHRSACSEAADN